MNEMQVFNFNESQIRTMLLDEIPWFIGKDVADILGYQNGSRDINRHVDEEDRHKVMLFDGNQDKETIIINESGLYSLILSSKMPNAKKFRHWVTSEVLPTIRRTGTYNTNNDYNRMELARLISSSRTAAGVKAIMIVFDVNKHVSELKTPNIEDSAGDFIRQYRGEIERVPTKKIYEAYCKYCEQLRVKPISHILFSKHVHKIYGFRTEPRKIKGKNYRVYMKSC